MKTLEKLIQVKEIITQLFVCLDYTYFRDNYKMISIDLSRQQALDPDPRKIQQINFTANLDRADDTRVYFILEESKETTLNFVHGTVEVL